MIEEMLVLDEMEVATGWTLLNDATENLEASTTHAWGKANSLEFDKKDGTGFFVCGAYKTVALDLRNWNPEDLICWLANAKAQTNLVNTFVRLGTDASNYLEWRFLVASMTANRFNLCSAKLGNAYVAAAGWNQQKVTYMVVGYTFTNETDALTDIEIDHVYLRRSVFTQT